MPEFTVMINLMWNNALTTALQNWERRFGKIMNLYYVIYHLDTLMVVKGKTSIDITNRIYFNAHPGNIIISDNSYIAYGTSRRAMYYCLRSVTSDQVCMYNP